MADYGVTVDGEAAILSADSTVTIWECVKAGLGVGVMLQEVAARSPDLERIVPEFTGVPVPFWLVSHKELRTSRRCRIVFNLLAEELRMLCQSGAGHRASMASASAM